MRKLGPMTLYVESGKEDIILSKFDVDGIYIIDDLYQICFENNWKLDVIYPKECYINIDFWADEFIETDIKVQIIHTKKS